MAFKKNENGFSRVVLLVLLGIPTIAATNIDCGRKSFHCNNSTHFMICVDLGGGVTSTIDSYMIPCPPPTECHANNKYECEFPVSTTPKIQLSDVTNEILNETTFVITTSLSESTTDNYQNISTTSMAPQEILTTDVTGKTNSTLPVANTQVNYTINEDLSIHILSNNSQVNNEKPTFNNNTSVTINPTDLVNTSEYTTTKSYNPENKQPINVNENLSIDTVSHNNTFNSKGFIEYSNKSSDNIEILTTIPQDIQTANDFTVAVVADVMNITTVTPKSDQNNKLENTTQTVTTFIETYPNAFSAAINDIQVTTPNIIISNTPTGGIIDGITATTDGQSAINSSSGIYTENQSQSETTLDLPSTTNSLPLPDSLLTTVDSVNINTDLTTDFRDLTISRVEAITDGVIVTMDTSYNIADQNSVTSVNTLPGLDNHLERANKTESDLSPSSPPSLSTSGTVLSTDGVIITTEIVPNIDQQNTITPDRTTPGLDNNLEIANKTQSDLTLSLSGNLTTSGVDNSTATTDTNSNIRDQNSVTPVNVLPGFDYNLETANKTQSDLSSPSPASLSTSGIVLSTDGVVITTETVPNTDQQNTVTPGRITPGLDNNLVIANKTQSDLTLPLSGNLTTSGIDDATATTDTFNIRDQNYVTPVNVLPGFDNNLETANKTQSDLPSPSPASLSTSSIVLSTYEVVITTETVLNTDQQNTVTPGRITPGLDNNLVIANKIQSDLTLPLSGNLTTSGIDDATVTTDTFNIRDQNSVTPVNVLPGFDNNLETANKTQSDLPSPSPASLSTSSIVLSTDGVVITTETVLNTDQQNTVTPGRITPGLDNNLVIANKTQSDLTLPLSGNLTTSGVDDSTATTDTSNIRDQDSVTPVNVLPGFDNNLETGNKTQSDLSSPSPASLSTSSIVLSTDEVLITTETVPNTDEQNTVTPGNITPGLDNNLVIANKTQSDLTLPLSGNLTTSGVDDATATTDTFNIRDQNYVTPVNVLPGFDNNLETVNKTQSDLSSPSPVSLSTSSIVLSTDEVVITTETVLNTDQQNTVTPGSITPGLDNNLEIANKTQSNLSLPLSGNLTTKGIDDATATTDTFNIKNQNSVTPVNVLPGFDNNLETANKTQSDLPSPSPASLSTSGIVLSTDGVIITTETVPNIYRQNEVTHGRTTPGLVNLEISNTQSDMLLSLPRNLTTSGVETSTDGAIVTTDISSNIRDQNSVTSVNALSGFDNHLETANKTQIDLSSLSPGSLTTINIETKTGHSNITETNPDMEEQNVTTPISNSFIIDISTGGIVDITQITEPHIIASTTLKYDTDNLVGVNISQSDLLTTSPKSISADNGVNINTGEEKSTKFPKYNDNNTIHNTINAVYSTHPEKVITTQSVLLTSSPTSLRSDVIGTTDTTFDVNETIQNTTEQNIEIIMNTTFIYENNVFDELSKLSHPASSVTDSIKVTTDVVTQSTDLQYAMDNTSDQNTIAQSSTTLRSDIKTTEVPNITEISILENFTTSGIQITTDVVGLDVTQNMQITGENNATIINNGSGFDNNKIEEKNKNQGDLIDKSLQVDSTTSGITVIKDTTPDTIEVMRNTSSQSTIIPKNMITGSNQDETNTTQTTSSASSTINGVEEMNGTGILKNDADQSSAFSTTIESGINNLAEVETTWKYLLPSSPVNRIINGNKKTTETASNIKHTTHNRTEVASGGGKVTTDAIANVINTTKITNSASGPITNIRVNESSYNNPTDGDPLMSSNISITTDDIVTTDSLLVINTTEPKGNIATTINDALGLDDNNLERRNIIKEPLMSDSNRGDYNVTAPEIKTTPGNNNTNFKEVNIIATKSESNLSVTGSIADTGHYVIPRNNFNNTKRSQSSPINDSITDDSTTLRTPAIVSYKSSQLSAVLETTQSTEANRRHQNVNNKRDNRSPQQTDTATRPSSTTRSQQRIHDDQKADTNINKNKVNFNCTHRTRGRYSDKDDCRKFYICIGRHEPIVSECPNNTVFSEYRKQCTKNFSHCIRGNEFQCVSEGRFSDFSQQNVFYICIERKPDSYRRYKLQCQNGYRLDKENVRCVENSEESKQSVSSINDDSRKEKTRNKAKDDSLNKRSSEEREEEETNDKQDDREESKEFICEEKGVFAHPTECGKYYKCSGNNKSEFRRRLKKCDTGRVFNKDKKKCVDAESYECV